MSGTMVLRGAGFTADMSDVARLQRNLKAYLAVKHKRTVATLLAHKGNQMRIELWRQFWAHRLVTRASRKTLAQGVRMFLRSVSGIKVRLDHLISPWDAKVPDVDKNGKKLSLRQKLVAQEILRRLHGSGVLGVSFLGKRWRFTKAQGAFLVENKTNKLGVAARFQLRDDEYRITGFTPGLEKVATRYGILGEVVRETSHDIEGYLSKLFGPEFVQQLHAR